MSSIETPELKDCGVIPAETWKSMTGLEVLKAIIARRLPPPPISGLIGFTLAEASEGRAVFQGEPAFRHYNPAGAVHGGYAGVLLDSAMTCAVQTTLEAGWGCVTLEYKISVGAADDHRDRLGARGRQRYPSRQAHSNRRGQNPRRPRQAARPWQHDLHGVCAIGGRQSALAISRNLNFCSLPVEVLGISVKTTVRGHL